MPKLPEPAPSRRIENIIDAAGSDSPYRYWRRSDAELADALQRATSDARSFERLARQRRIAIRRLTALVLYRADMAARLAACKARHRELMAAAVAETLIAAE